MKVNSCITRQHLAFLMKTKKQLNVSSTGSHTLTLMYTRFISARTSLPEFTLSKLPGVDESFTYFIC